MNLKTELAELKERLNGLKDRIEADDQEAINEGMQLKADIEAKEAEIETAEKKAAVLGKIGKTEGEVKDMENLGIKGLNLEALVGAPGKVSTYLEKTAAPVQPAVQYTYDTNIPLAQPELLVRNAFGQEQISTNALTYYRMTGMEGTIGATTTASEAKDYIQPTYTPVTAALNKTGAYIKETDEFLHDNVALESAVRARGIYEFNKAVEAYLVSALSAVATTSASTCNFETLLSVKQSIKAATGYTPDTILINPADLTTLLATKDLSGQFVLGGPAYGAYGNGNYNPNPRIWGMEVIESNAVSAGDPIVGAFKIGASVVTKAGEGFRVEVSNSDQDDFIKNIITVRLEERMLLAVRVPQAFVLMGQT